MKKITAMFAALIVMAATIPACASDDRPITVDQLPAAAQQFIKTHFANHTVSYAAVDTDLLDKDYKVVFSDGCKVDFRKNGEWKEVSHPMGVVPAAIIPKQIAEYVAAHHPGQAITKIDRDRRDYEIELANGLDLKFDLQFRLIEIDD